MFDWKKTESTMIVLVIFGMSVAVSAQSLQLKVTFTKKAYLEMEPPILSLSLTNVSKTDLRVAEPLVREGFITLCLTDASGKDVNVPRLVWDVAMPPKDYGYRLGAGQSVTAAWSMAEQYPLGLPPGTYRVTATYDTAKKRHVYTDLWHGTVASNAATFDVTAPPETEKRAFAGTRESQEILAKTKKEEYDQAREKLRLVVNEHPDSNYAPYAAYLLAESYLMRQVNGKQDCASAAQHFDAFLARYPMYVYYADLVRTTELPYSLLETGQREKANAVLDKAPDGYYKERTRKRVGQTFRK